MLALVGEAGVGKSALLSHAVEQSAGMTLLRARGIESEALVPFAGLLELLRPLLGMLDRIPPPQAEALAIAFALRTGHEQSRFAVGAATLSLLAACGEEGPTLVVIDDAHWIDESSGTALRFALRRLIVDPIAALIAVRAETPSFLDGSDFPTLSLAGIDRESTRALLAGVTGAIALGTVNRLYDLTLGNPLALLENAPTAHQLQGLSAADPVPVSTRTADAFLERFRHLPDRNRRMLVLTAASGSADLDTLARAAASLDLVLEDLVAAELAGLVRLEHGVVAFRHPLVRSAIYSGADPNWRREAHRALAAALPGGDDDRRPWHLAAASIGPDSTASAALERTGRRAHSRSAFSESAAALERAAQLASDAGRRDDLLLAAADAAWLAGQSDRSASMLEELRSHEPGPELAGRIEHLRGQLAMRRGPVLLGRNILVAAAEAAATAGQPDLAVALLAEGANACFYAGDSAGLTAIAHRAVELTPEQAGAETLFLATIVSGMASVLRGEGDAGAMSIRRAIEIFESTDEFAGDVRLLVWAVVGTLWIREISTGSTLIERAVSTAREQVAIGALPHLLHHLARYQATSDQWSSASANYHEAIRLSRETNQRTDLASALAGLAWLEAREGSESARARVAEARELCGELGAGIYDIWALIALADLELGLGRPQEALPHLIESIAELHKRDIADVDVSPAPELVEVHLRLGDVDSAAKVASDFDREAAAKGRPWALARAARCRGLLAPESLFAEEFARAFELHSQTPDVFETARTHLAFGVRLRRTRQRVRAREELRVALETFERLGAAGWADQASAELDATGETARRRHASTLDQLTPQEQQIGALLASGRTTREAAAALFLSPKTIEYHLDHVYRKLGIRSRQELAAALASLINTQ